MTNEITHVNNWREKIVYSREGPQPQVLMETEDYRVILAGLEPGAKIPPHPEAGAVYHILEGNGWMTVNDQRLAVRDGSIVSVPNGGTRGLEAETRLAFLAVRVPVLEQRSP